MSHKRKYSTYHSSFQRAFQFAFSNLKFAIILCLTFPTPLLAASPYIPTYADPVLEPWRWTSYPELKGLGLHYIAEDSTGAIWFGINKGVIRYDGTTWTTYTSDNGLARQLGKNASHKSRRNGLRRN